MDEIQKQIEEALKKVTPGHWTKVEFFSGTMEVWQNLAYSHDGNQQYIARMIGNNDTATHNADLIANAPEWLRHQQSIISQQSTEIAKLQGYLMQTAEEWPCTCGDCDGEHFGFARKENSHAQTTKA